MRSPEKTPPQKFHRFIKGLLLQSDPSIYFHLLNIRSCNFYSAIHYSFPPRYSVVVLDPSDLPSNSVTSPCPIPRNRTHHHHSSNRPTRNPLTLLGSRPPRCRSGIIYVSRWTMALPRPFYRAIHPLFRSAQKLVTSRISMMAAVTSTKNTVSCTLRPLLPPSRGIRLGWMLPMARQ